MLEIKYYKITYNSDKIEGKGSIVDTNFGFSSYKEAAKFLNSSEYAEKYGVMGLPGNPLQLTQETITIFDSNEEYYNRNPGLKKVREILKGLTKEEIKILKSCL